MNCTKAIISVAGFGTRRLPITKTFQKCMLPIGNRPIVDYIVEDSVKAGITDIYFYVDEHSGGDQVRIYYERNAYLESFLEDRGKTEELQALRTMYEGTRFHFLDGSYRPEEGYGTAIPVSRFDVPLAPNEQVLVMMGDDFIYSPDGSSEAARLLQAAEAAGVAAAIVAVAAAPEELHKYGVLDVHEGFLQGIAEKPAAADAPSRLINISKYVFNEALFQATRDLINGPPGSSGEYYIVDAITNYVKGGGRLLVHKAAGEYLDGGTLEGWLYANNRICGQP